MSPVAPALQADSLLLSHWGSPMHNILLSICLSTHNLNILKAPTICRNYVIALKFVPNCTGLVPSTLSLIAGELDCEEKLSTEELMLLNCDARENSWKNPLDSKEIKLVNPKGNQH